MHTISATCPTCGSVELHAERLLLVECTVREWSYSTFRCPGCRTDVRRDAPSSTRRLLLRRGVEVEPWHVPAEALEQRDAPPLTADDVLDAVLLLRDPATDLAALACAARPTSSASSPATPTRPASADRPEHPDVW